MNKICAKHIISVLLYYSGALALYRRARGGRLTILAYHGVKRGPFYVNMFMDVEKFEAQVRFLAENYKIVSMKEAEDLVRRGEAFRQDMVAVTLDDGYKDNYEHVFPIARKYKAPMTVYLTTRCVDTGEPTFVYYLILALDCTDRPSLDMSDAGLGSLPLGARVEKEAAVIAVDRLSKKMRFEEREALLAKTLDRLGFRKEDPLFQNKMLTWDEVKEMRAGGFVFGAHTITHPVLAALSPEEVRREMVESKRGVERGAGAPADLFAYTYGKRADVGAAVIEEAKAHFSSAVVLYREPLSAGALHAMGRTMVTDEMVSGITGRFSQAVFACEMSGIFDRLMGRSGL